MDISNREYKRAFEAYIRQGTPISRSLMSWSLKQAQAQERTTTHYIWRTRRDGRVRPSHAANDGQIFSWDNPPPTGHPGEEYGCRCTADPYTPVVEENMTMRMSGIVDKTPPWSNIREARFVIHYWGGNGRKILLRDTGNLQDVVDEYRRLRENALLGQIADAARQQAGSSFSYDFNNSYYMRHIVFCLGDATIGGVAKGRSRMEKSGALRIEGHCDFYLKDEYTDPLDGDPIIGIPFDLPFSTPYPITDEWDGQFGGAVYPDRERSYYKYDLPE